MLRTKNIGLLFAILILSHVANAFWVENLTVLVTDFKHMPIKDAWVEVVYQEQEYDILDGRIGAYTGENGMANLVIVNKVTNEGAINDTYIINVSYPILFSCYAEFNITNEPNVTTTLCLFSEDKFRCKDLGGLVVICPPASLNAGKVVVAPPLGWKEENGTLAPTVYPNIFECSIPYTLKPSPGIPSSCRVFPSQAVVSANDSLNLIAICFDIRNNTVKCPRLSWRSDIGNVGVDEGGKILYRTPPYEINSTRIYAEYSPVQMMNSTKVRARYHSEIISLMLPMRYVLVNVSDLNGTPLQNVSVRMNDVITKTNSTGIAVFRVLEGTYNVTAFAYGEEKNTVLTVSRDENITFTFNRTVRNIRVIDDMGSPLNAIVLADNVPYKTDENGVAVLGDVAPSTLVVIYGSITYATNYTETVVLDMHAPRLTNFSYEPKNPFEIDRVEVSVFATDPEPYASGVGDVFVVVSARNTTYQMRMTQVADDKPLYKVAIAPIAGDINVTIKAVAFDKFGNKVETMNLTYTVKKGEPIKIDTTVLPKPIAQVSDLLGAYWWVVPVVIVAIIIILFFFGGGEEEGGERKTLEKASG